MDSKRADADALQRVRDEALAAQIGLALARRRPTVDDVLVSEPAAHRDDEGHAPVDARVEAPWGAFARRTTTDEWPVATATAVIPPRWAPPPVVPRPRRRRALWPWFLAATMAAGVAVHFAVPEFWPDVGQRANAGALWLRDAVRDLQSHRASTPPRTVASPTHPASVAMPGVATPQSPSITTSPRTVTRSSATPPPPAPVATRPRRPAKRRAQPRPSTRDAENTVAIDTTAADTTVTDATATDATAADDPTPTPPPREDPPREAPPIQEPPSDLPDVDEPPEVELPSP